MTHRAGNNETRLLLSPKVLNCQGTRANLNLLLLEHESRLRQETQAADDDELVAAASAIWKQCFFDSRASGSDRRRRWFSGLKRKSGSRQISEAEFLRKRRKTSIRLLEEQQRQSTLDSIINSAKQLAGEAWTPRHQEAAG